jgi:uncharacterized protein (DUF952 family)
MSMTTLYKICRATEWDAARAAGKYEGSEVDRRDGYIHLSTAAQVAETARRHFAGQDGLVLVALEEAGLGPNLRYEPARGGDLFPHVYGSIDPGWVRWVKPLRLGPDGMLILPAIA